MRMLSRALVLLCLALLAVAWAMPSLAQTTPTGDASSLARRTVELTNQERAKEGLLPLKWNDTMAAAALAHARDMAERNYFAHNSPEGTSPTERARQAGYPAYGWGGLYVGENLARGYSEPERAMQGWMASEGHRRNILNPKYREIGVGVVLNSRGTGVWAQEFGSRPKELPVFINGDAPATESARITLSISTESVSSWGSVKPIAQMMIGNTPDFAGSSWEPYSSSKEWTLKEESGFQRVYVRLKDGTGAVVESVDEILLERQPAHSSSQPQSMAFQPPSAAQEAPQFKLGFKLLADQIPTIVGNPLENEHWGANGDSLQQTDRGLLVWRRADNHTAFTDGTTTWVNGPLGLQVRGNQERFAWE